MKTIINFAGQLALALLLIGSWRETTAQSKIAEATNWFNLGVRENDANKKIAAYEKAIALDPNFVEALYNLGVLYKQRNEFENAERYLSKALASASAPQRGVKAELKLQILYELASTQKKLGKTKEAEQNFREAKVLTTATEVRAAIVLELGRLLIEQGRYGEAVTELKAGQSLASKRRNEMQNLLQLAENEIELGRLFAAAEKAKASGNWQEAKTLLLQIKAKKPGDKTIEALLAAVETSQQVESQKQAVATLSQQAQQHATAGNWELAIASYEALLQQNPNDKDARAKLEAARQQLEQRQLKEKLESEYAAGLAALKGHDWTRAILAFEKVLEEDRNFRDVRKRLAEAQSGLERESTETIIARYYAEGVAAMNRNDLGGALAAFEKVRRINPNYRDSARLLAEIEKALRLKAAPVAANIDSLYQMALAAFAQKDWMQAVVNLEKVRLLQPNYRDVVNRLAEARSFLVNPSASQSYVPEGTTTKVVAPNEATNFSFLPLYGALAALSLVGIVILSPTARARFHVLRGNYAAGVRIYEKILARHPQRVKLYLPLANLYLLLGRRDEAALKIFKTILLLNLATQNRDEISTIVAQNYLTEGRTDSDAIEVLEGALQAEQRRLRRR